MENSQPQSLCSAAEKPAAQEILRGVTRLFASHGLAAISELTLPNGRRADAAALAKDGAIFIVEIKSSLEDFRADHKWHEYREYCDRLYFAVRPGFPVHVLPEDTGLIFADAYGGEFVREAPNHRLGAPRRKAMLIRLARVAAQRLATTVDPALTLLTES